VGLVWGGIVISWPLVVGRWPSHLKIKYFCMSNYKQLDLWNLSMSTVKEVYMLTRSYPIEEKYGLISQTNRAAISIPSNIAEGLGRNHKKDTIQFLYISRGSSYEVETLLSIAFMVNIIDEQSFNKLSDLLEKNLQVINGFINYLEQKI
jgi:four helix bundle protein